MKDPHAAAARRGDALAIRVWEGEGGAPGRAPDRAPYGHGRAGPNDLASVSIIPGIAGTGPGETTRRLS